MNSEEMNKYAYELMVKNNPREAIQRLMLLDKLEEIINKAIKYIEEHELTTAYATDGDEFQGDFIEIIDILKGEENGK